MRELLTSKGFYKFGQCSCGGTLTEKYRSNELNQVMVKIKPNRSYFEIFLSNKLVSKGHSNNFSSELGKYVG